MAGDDQLSTKVGLLSLLSRQAILGANAVLLQDFRNISEVLKSKDGFYAGFRRAHGKIGWLGVSFERPLLGFILGWQLLPRVL